MICNDCRSGGNLITSLRTQDDQAVKDTIILQIKKYFDQCRGLTWCDNQKRF